MYMCTHVYTHVSMYMCTHVLPSYVHLFPDSFPAQENSTGASWTKSKGRSPALSSGSALRVSWQGPHLLVIVLSCLG